jgi:hypothetical protein
MIKLGLVGLSGCFITILMTVACVKTVEQTGIKKMTIYDTRHTILSIQDCSLFLDDEDSVMGSLDAACRASGFELIDVSREILSEHVYVLHVYGTQGYASLWVNDEEKSCVLEYFSSNERYDYVSFINAFMREFNAVEIREDHYHQFTELLE